MGDSVSEKAQPAIHHGGNLGKARLLFPQAPEPWIDLSTGINPHSYPHSPIPATAFSRLPEPGLLETLKHIAAGTYSAPSANHIVAAPGTQSLLPLLSDLVGKTGRKTAAVLSPTYAEHARAARMNGFEVNETNDIEILKTVDLAIIVNPNNPTGRIVSRENLFEIAKSLRERGGVLVVDEAFGDAIIDHESLCGSVDEGNIVVLRSFGKFYGMAGLRLGFAVSSINIIKALELRLGPWAVSGPALHVASEALANHDWQTQMLSQLKDDAARLDGLLHKAGLTVVGGTNLFRLVRHPSAQEVFQRLGENGILVRAFEERPDDLRLGLPECEDEWKRLDAALTGQ
jgi:cobalamin biosynthetic protein CobC